MRLLVLVVDDDPLARKAYARSLKSGGVEVRVAATADEALEIVAQDPLDVIVTDIVMPQRTGIDLLRDVRARGLDTPVVLMSGHSDVDTSALPGFGTLVRFLPKPFPTPVALYEQVLAAHDAWVAAGE